MAGNKKKQPVKRGSRSTQKKAKRPTSNKRSRSEKITVRKTGQPAARAFFSQRNNYLQNLYVFNGEKDLGELGPSKDYFLDYTALRSRGNQFYLDNEVVQSIINAMNDWVIGNGLSLESEPNEVVLNSEGIEINIQSFTDLVEARFQTIKESKESSYSKMKNLSQLESKAFIAASNGGDILVIIRVKKGIVNYELIDGTHVRGPLYGNDLNPNLLENGNRVMNGVEMNDAGEHIAYWVQKYDMTYSRILAKSTSTGLTMAFLYGGLEYRLDNSRAIPALSGLFQALSQMDEYKTATLGSAKEQNSLAYQAVTELGGTGENTVAPLLARAQDYNANDGTIPVDSDLLALANTVQVSTKKTTFAPPPGTEIKPINKNEAELYFEVFWKTLFEIACAAAGIPPNVVLKRFDTSFSSARAAIKDWEHSLLLKRYKHGLGFLQPGYELQLHLDIMSGKVQAEGYLKAFNQNNTMVLAAYRKARWIGDNVPHIDPKKEVEAEREKLGALFANAPLTTVKKATENLNGGSSKSNIEDGGAELKFLKTNGFDMQPTPVESSGLPQN